MFLHPYIYPAVQPAILMRSRGVGCDPKIKRSSLPSETSSFAVQIKAHVYLKKGLKVLLVSRLNFREGKAFATNIRLIIKRY